MSSSPSRSPSQESDTPEQHRRGRKRNRQASESDEEPSDDESIAQNKRTYRHYGRAFARLVDPGFCRLHQVVEHGLALEAADSDDDDGPTSRESPLDKSWDLLDRMIPGFKDMMISNLSNRDYRRKICKRIGKGVSNARSDDTGGMKSAVVGWLLEDPAGRLPLPLPAQDERKSLRGWTHPVTAMLLTPMALSATEETFLDVRLNRIQVTAEMWPRFMYPHGHMYNKEDEEDGLFMGHLMIRAAKHIFMGPAAALQGPGFTRGTHCIAQRIGMSVITPRALAYVAVQVRFALCEVEKWATVDRHFNLAVFYWNIVSFFNNGEGKHVLDFYNYQLFGEARQLQGILITPDANDHEPTAMERLNIQRAAKRARHSAPTPPPPPPILNPVPAVD